jgi:hypothetical protein
MIMNGELKETVEGAVVIRLEMSSWRLSEGID